MLCINNNGALYTQGQGIFSYWCCAGHVLFGCSAVRPEHTRRQIAATCTRRSNMWQQHVAANFIVWTGEFYRKFCRHDRILSLQHVAHKIKPVNFQWNVNSNSHQAICRCNLSLQCAHVTCRLTVDMRRFVAVVAATCRSDLSPRVFRPYSTTAEQHPAQQWQHQYEKIPWPWVYNAPLLFIHNICNQI